MKSINEEQAVGESIRDCFESGEIYVPVEQVSWIDLLGADRGKVLGNLTTNHVAGLAPGEGCETFITDARGKTFGHGFVYALDDRLRLLTVGDQFERLSAHIDRYVIREDLTIEDRTAELHTVFIPGVGQTRLTTRLGLTAAEPPRLKTQIGQLDAVELRIYQVPYTRDADWLLQVPAAQADALDAALVALDILPGHCSLMHCGRITNHFPWFGIDFTEANLPQEMDRDDRAISFRKGCYLGQETIARLDAMGQVQKKLLLWRFDGSVVPPQGTELRQGEKVVATVTSGTYCFAHHAPFALALTRRSHFAPGATAESEYGTATVVDPNAE
ncbi:CAF17-like 4Fe-4S cluster assembly/insertion protein YgfZ [Candidatus Laterigemmans baculatus]|uniref:CAF17-like 4Fe-4S cluster assembly/insertion protein YgfZ n=1 Tax=Candidatus Laterigemmans baculatus TaxID=2770505 RepID=UPI0013DBE969|nr:hypothetical protein [Candidatus Laterigemmans baculatus]